MKEIQAQGLGLVGISYDSPAILAAFSRQRGITFPLLSDEGSATIRAFGILNPVVEMGLGPDKDDPAVIRDVQKLVSANGRAAEMMRGMALPGTFVVNRQGRVTSRYFEEFYVERNTTESVMLKLGAAASPGAPAGSVAGTRVSTGQLDLTVYPSDAAVAPGNRFALVVDVVPHAGMHVYAPGAKGYKPIAVTLADQPWVEHEPTKYPASEIYFFRPLNERVPVFQKPFRMTVDMLLQGSTAAQAALQGKDALTIAGTVDFQACDDKVCYNPASAPVTWTLALKALVRERPPASAPAR